MTRDKSPGYQPTMPDKFRDEGRDGDEQRLAGTHRGMVGICRNNEKEKNSRDKQYQ